MTVAPMNPSSPTAIGLEWMVDTAPGTFVLGSAATAYGLYVPRQVGSTAWNQIQMYAAAVSGSAALRAEVYGFPLVDNVPATYDTDYPGTDTGADFTSVLNGGAAWLQGGGGAATYVAVSPGTDDTLFLRNINALETPPCHMMMRGANAVQLAGKRVLSVEVHARVRTVIPNFNAWAIGMLNLSGANYRGTAQAIPTNNGYNDLLFGTWTVNPKTGLPWTLPDINNLITVGATDSFGVHFEWVYGIAVDQVRVSQIYLRVKWQAEDRVAYGSPAASVTAPGWVNFTMKSTPNLLTAQQSDFEANNTNGWSPSACILANSTADFFSGARSLKCTSTAATAFGAFQSGAGGYSPTPVIPGKPYSAMAMARITTGAPRSVFVTIIFYDANSNTITTSSGTPVSSNNAWIAAFCGPVIAPANAVYAIMTVATTAGAVNDVMYIDNAFLSLGQAALCFAGGVFGPFVSPPTGAAEISGVFTQTTERALYVLRRLSGGGNVSIPTIGPGSSAVGQPGGLASYRPLASDDAGSIGTFGAASTDTSAISWISTAAALMDAQPYVRRVSATVDVSNTVRSELTTPVGTYGQVRLLVAGFVDPPTAPLLIKLRKVSDDSQVGGTATIQPTDLAQLIPAGGAMASRTTPQVLQVQMASTATTGAVQHYLELSSAAAAGTGWLVYALDDAYGSGGGLDSSTFGGTTDQWNDPLNGGRHAGQDGMITLLTIPTTPGSFAGVIQ